MNDFQLRDFVLNYLWENYPEQKKKYFFLSPEKRKNFLKRCLLFLVHKNDDFKFEISVETIHKMNDYIDKCPGEIVPGHRQKIQCEKYKDDDLVLNKFFKSIGLRSNNAKVYIDY